MAVIYSTVEHQRKLVQDLVEILQEAESLADIREALDAYMPHIRGMRAHIWIDRVGYNGYPGYVKVHILSQHSHPNTARTKIRIAS